MLTAAVALMATTDPSIATASDEIPLAEILAEPGYIVADLVNASGAVPAGLGTLTYSAILTFTPGTAAPAVSQVTVTQRAVDFDGATIGAERVITEAVTLGSNAQGNAAAVGCGWRGPKRHGVSVFTPQTVRVTMGIGTLDLSTAFARAARTADVVGQPAAAQWVGCAAGGAQLIDGYRLIEAGGGSAYTDAVNTARFGTAWRSIEAPESYELRSGFPVAYDDTGAMVGTVHQAKGGYLLGSFSAPVSTPVEQFDRNAAYSYWQDPCVNSPACPGAEGSRGFHGATAHAVWALPGKGPRSFAVAGYVHYACANLADPACN